MMIIARIAAVTLVVGLSAAACNRQQPPSETVERTADVQQERTDDISQLNERVSEIEKKYAENNAEVVSGDRTATAGLREELKEDVANVKEAVAELTTTTADNWWDRNEQAMRRTADDVEADVRRLAGNLTSARPGWTSNEESARGTTGEQASSAPFTSRRDAFVEELRARTDGFLKALDGVKAKGPADTELDDTRARIQKLREDIDELRSASPEKWWDVSKERVEEYIDRVEGSIARLDDNKR
jgi:hypothetical protein